MVSTNDANELPLLEILPRGRAAIVTIVATMRHSVKDQALFARRARLREIFADAAFIRAGEGECRIAQSEAAELGLAIARTSRSRERRGVACSLRRVVLIQSRRVSTYPEYMPRGGRSLQQTWAATRSSSRRRDVYLIAAGDSNRGPRPCALLADDERARRMGARGREMSNENFPPKATRQHEALYDRTLAAARTKTSRGVHA